MTVKHTITSAADSFYYCSACEQQFKRSPQYSDCPGVKVWKWDDWDKHGLLTKKMLYEAGYSTGKTKLPKPAGAVKREKSPDGWMYLYNPADAVERKVDEATKARLDLAREKYMLNWKCKRCGGRVRWYRDMVCPYCEDELFLMDAHNEAIEIAKKWMLDKSAVIVDCETTGLDCHRDAILSIGIIDLEGNELFYSLVKPPLVDGKIEVGKTDIHGITPEMVSNAPEFPEIYPQLVGILHNATMLAYNDYFDYSFIWWSCSKYDLPNIEPSKRRDVMRLFAQWFGEYSNYYKDFKWQSLPGATHNALEDCLETLKLLKSMAESEPEEDPLEPKEVVS